MQTLIAKNKIINLLNLNPDAEIPLLLWLKEIQLMDYPTSEESYFGHCCAQLGASNYYIDIIRNPSLEIAYISSLATSEERQKRMAHEREKLAANPDVITELVISVPPPLRFTRKSSSIQSEKPKLPLFTETEAPQPERETFSSREDYEQALGRALEIFHSRRGTSEFDELASLIPLIKAYEDFHIQLPPLLLHLAVKSRMNELQIKPEYIPASIGSREEIERYLSGGKYLPKKQLRALLKMLSLHFTV